MDIHSDIVNYINHLKMEYQLDICLSRLNPLLFEESLLFYSVHNNPYCSCLKKNADFQKYCYERQRYVFEKARQHNPLFGSCHAGVVEYVFPVTFHNEDICMICISGYASDAKTAKEKMLKLTERFNFNETEIKRYYSDFLKPVIPQKDIICAIIRPLIYMLQLFFSDKQKEAENPVRIFTLKDKIYRDMLVYISSNYNGNISISDLSRELHYSASYLWKIFITRNKHTPTEYINLFKINKAKELLNNTPMRILDIAFSVGFNDSNYFTNIFRKYCGTSPSQFRKLSQLESQPQRKN